MRMLFILVLCVGLLVACGGPADEAAVDITPVESPTAAPPTATAAPTATVAPTETPTTEPLTPSAIFERLSPSMAHISVPGGGGSGALLEGGYILTNAHVVWPHDAADVAFPDGTTFEAVPLAARDPLRDIALLGPVEVDLPPIIFVDGESAVVGSEILLIGYPGESDHAPQPALTEGLISRVREWEGGGVTFFQTSSAVAGGQSGGIAVSPDGEPVGLSGLRFTEANYGLIASAADLMIHVERLPAEEQAETGFPPEPVKRDRWTFETIHDIRAYRVDAPDTDVTVSVDGPSDAVLIAVYPDGTEETYSDSGLYGEEEIHFTTPAEAVPLFVLVDHEQERTGTVEFSLTSNTPLTLVEDADDGQTIHRGDVYTGTVDFPYDADVFEMTLGQGDVINLRADTIGFDPMLVIDAGMGLEEMLFDHDSGGGLFDVNAEITYQAPRGGTYTVVVYDLDGNAHGAGYILAATEPYEGAPTPTVPDPTPTPIASAVGPMRLFDEAEIPFTLEVPFQFVEDWHTATCRDIPPADTGLMLCLSDPDPNGRQLGVVLLVEDAQELGLPGLTLDEMADAMRELYSSSPNYHNLTETRIETADGDEAVVISVDAGNEGVRLTRLMATEGDRMGYNITFLYFAEEQATVDYIISTFRLR